MPICTKITMIKKETIEKILARNGIVFLPEKIDYIQIICNNFDDLIAFIENERYRSSMTCRECHGRDCEHCVGDFR